MRKEVFAPWFEGKQNIELIYRQIVDGLERGMSLARAWGARLPSYLFFSFLSF